VSLNKILVLGASGMLGYTLFHKYSKDNRFVVFGTIRNEEDLRFFKSNKSNILCSIDAMKIATIEDAIKNLKPDLIINCIGIIKQLKESKNHLLTIKINSLFPHQLAELAGKYSARLVLISTDCVFDGVNGNYTEDDDSNATDLYGKTKYLGEIGNEKHVITLRTSIIGHELKHHISLVDWFLNQNNEVNGFANAIYTGFPTVEFAHIISNVIIPNKDISGLFNVSAEKINKFELITLISRIYEKQIKIIPYDKFVCDRSLDSSKFRALTNYTPPSWESMIKDMYKDYLENY